MGVAGVGVARLTNRFRDTLKFQRNHALRCVCARMTDANDVDRVRLREWEQRLRTMRRKLREMAVPVPRLNPADYPPVGQETVEQAVTRMTDEYVLLASTLEDYLRAALSQRPQRTRSERAAIAAEREASRAASAAEWADLVSRFNIGNYGQRELDQGVAVAVFQEYAPTYPNFRHLTLFNIAWALTFTAALNESHGPIVYVVHNPTGDLERVGLRRDIWEPVRRHAAENERLLITLAITPHAARDYVHYGPSVQEPVIILYYEPTLGGHGVWLDGANRPAYRRLAELLVSHY